MSLKRWAHAVAAAALTAIGASLPAQEDGWFSALVSALEKERAAASAFDSGRLRPPSAGPGWSAAFASPWSSDGASGSLAVDPKATIQLSSPDVGADALTWKIGAGAAASLSRESASSRLGFRAGPLLTIEGTLRLAGRSTFSGSPSERLRTLELQGKLLESERASVARLLEAAGFASRSAAALSDRDYAAAKAAYLEKEARRVEIELGDGRVPMASYAAARDAWERAKMGAEAFRYDAEALGRQAWAAARAPIPEPTAAFGAAGLYRLGQVVADLLGSPDPTAQAVAEAAAPWDLRIAELDLQALDEAPRLSVSLELAAFPAPGGASLLPTAEGDIGLSLPLSATAAARGERAATLASMRREAASAASASSALGFSEAKRALALSKDRIASLEALTAERQARAESWSRLMTQGAANLLDSLAAAQSLAEARAALDRERAGYFLSAVAAFSVSGLRLSSLLQAAGSAPRKR